MEPLEPWHLAHKEALCQRASLPKQAEFRYAHASHGIFYSAEPVNYNETYNHVEGEN